MEKAQEAVRAGSSAGYLSVHLDRGEGVAKLDEQLASLTAQGLTLLFFDALGRASDNDLGVILVDRFIDFCNANCRAGCTGIFSIDPDAGDPTRVPDGLWHIADGQIRYGDS